MVRSSTNAPEELAQDSRDRRQISRTGRSMHVGCSKPTSGEKRPCCASRQSPNPLLGSRQTNRSSSACPVGRVDWFYRTATCGSGRVRGASFVFGALCSPTCCSKCSPIERRPLRALGCGLAYSVLGDRLRLSHVRR